MEGDIYSVPLPALLGFGAAVLGGVFGLVKWLAAKMLDEIETRLKRIDELESRVEQLIADMPLHYQRREDAIREYTSLQSKLDRIYELVLEMRRG